MCTYTNANLNGDANDVLAGPSSLSVLGLKTEPMECCTVAPFLQQRPRI
jgi:hypothetical protein